ncbi:MAG: ribose ABC transporter permease, partial [Veillonella sp.]|nr:ribose ABC transporter permease [Veillonella sp.]
MDSKALQYVKKLGPLIGLILLFIIISVMNDSFLEFSNLRNLLRQVSINAIIAFGMTFVILTGGIDLSVGSILALSSAVMANLIVTGTDPVLAIVLAAGAGLVLGGINGLV